MGIGRRGRIEVDETNHGPLTSATNNSTALDARRTWNDWRDRTVVTSLDKSALMPWVA